MYTVKLIDRKNKNNYTYIRIHSNIYADSSFEDATKFRKLKSIRQFYKENVKLVLHHVYWTFEIEYIKY